MSNTPAQPWCVIAGGGTAGHVLPGLSVADALVERGHDKDSIRFLGSIRGAENELVPVAGYGLDVLPGRGLNGRKINLANLRAAVDISRGVLRSISLIRRSKPKVILALGGFASVPGIIAGALWRIPIVVTEQNAKASLANRLGAKFAKACAVPFIETDLPKAVLTGNPVRPEIVEAALVAQDETKREELRSRHGVDADTFLIFVQSGSLGARSVNRAVIEWAQSYSGSHKVHVHHVIGRRDWQSEHAQPPVRGDDILTYNAKEYEYETPDLMAACDLFVGRSGASTVAELAVIGVPAVLVPLPVAPRDAQGANARAIESSGAVSIIRDHDLDSVSLGEAIEAVMCNPAATKEAVMTLRKLGRPYAAVAVAELLEEHARK